MTDGRWQGYIGVRITMTALGFLLCCAGVGQPWAGDLSRDITSIDDISLEEILSDPVVETMTLRAQRAGEVPGTIVAFRGEELRALGLHSLRDAISYVLNTSTHPGPEGPVYTFREMDDWFNSKILFLVDGIPVNDPTRGGFTAYSCFPIEEIRQLELVLGPGSALYGANALSGVISVRTWTGNERRGLEAGLGTGSETYHEGATRQLAHVAYSSGPGQTSFRISGYFNSLEGDDPINVSGNPYSLHQTDHGNADLAVGNLRVRFQHGATEVSAGLHRSEVGTPGLAFYPTPDDRDMGQVLDASFSREIIGGPTSRLLLLGSFQNFRSDLNTAHRFEAEKEISPELLQKGEIPLLIDGRDGIAFYAYDPTDGLFHECDLSGNQIPGGRELDVTGAEYLVPISLGSDKTKASNSVDQGILQSQYQHCLSDLGGIVLALEGKWSGGRAEVEPGGEANRNLAAYGQADCSIGRWTFLLGGRLDDHSSYGTFASPRASLVWRPLSGTVGKLSVSRAFRGPSGFELHGDVDYRLFRIEGNPELGVEKITAWEGSLVQAIRPGFRARVTGFHYRVTDEIGTTWILGDRYFYAEQLPGAGVPALIVAEAPALGTYKNWETPTYREGIEVELEGTVGRGIRTALGVATTHIEKRSDLGDVDEEIWNRYRTSSLLWRIEGRAPGGKIHARLNVPSEVATEFEKTAAKQAGSDLEDRPFYENWDQADLAIGYRFDWGHFHVGLRGENLLGSDKRTINLPGFGYPAEAFPLSYTIDLKPAWYVKVGWNE